MSMSGILVQTHNSKIQNCQCGLNPRNPFPGYASALAFFKFLTRLGVILLDMQFASNCNPNVLSKSNHVINVYNVHQKNNKLVHYFANVHYFDRSRMK